MTDEQLPPHSPESEQCVLGCLLLAGAVHEAESIFAGRSDVFFDLRHRKIYEAIVAVHRSGLQVDPLSVSSRMREEATLEEAGGIAYLAGLPDLVHSADQLPHHAEIIRNKLAARQLITTCEWVRGKASNGGSLPDLVNQLHGDLHRLNLGGLSQACPLGSLQMPPREESELLQNRFLCRHGSLLLVGRTGLGKSSLALQWAISWAVGRVSCGLMPTRPLRSLLIQAENDPGDLVEMRQGIFEGLKMSTTQRATAGDSVLVETVDDCIGQDFILRRLAPLIRQHQPDLVWLDPLLAYLGGDVSRQDVVSQFLRAWLMPLIHRANAAAILLHHTPKPPKDKQHGGGWTSSDFAYAGAGSSELANWPRAVITLEPTDRLDKFRLRLGKRGRRAGWLEEDMETPAILRMIAHGDTGIYWNEDAGPVEDSYGHEDPKGPPTHTKDNLAAMVPIDKPISKDSLLSKAQDRGIGLSRAKGWLRVLLEEGVLHEWRIPRPKARPEIHLARGPQPEPELPVQ